MGGFSFQHFHFTFILHFVPYRGFVFCIERVKHTGDSNGSSDSAVTWLTSVGNHLKAHRTCVVNAVVHQEMK